MVFLVPDSDSRQVKSEYEYAVERNKNISLVLWSDVTKEIKFMLDDENEAKIIPMSYYLKQTLKAFYYYINHLTDIKIRKKVEVTYKKYPRCCYDLVMLSDGRMRIRSKNQNEDDVEEGLIPKHMIYDVLFALGKKSNIQTRYGKGIDGTPRVLGAEMFGMLENKRLTKIEIKDNRLVFLLIIPEPEVTFFST